MIRYALVSLLVAATAAAQPAPRKANWIGDRRIAVVTPTSGFTPATGQVTGVIYVDRCSGGCQVTQSDHSDANQHLSPDVQPGTSTLTEFENDAREIGTAADAEWAEVVKCMQEVYSPYDGHGDGSAADLGSVDRDPDRGSAAGPRLPRHRARHRAGARRLQRVRQRAVVRVRECRRADLARIYNVCWTAAQETAHNFGLDHEYQYATGDSACNDPMTYRYDCGGEKFFRDEGALLRRERRARVHLPRTRPRTRTRRSSRCSDRARRSRRRRRSRSSTRPTGDAIVQRYADRRVGGAQRGVARRRALRSTVTSGPRPSVRQFGANGQPETTYAITVANGRSRRRDRSSSSRRTTTSSVETDSATVTVTKGAPCADASSCLRRDRSATPASASGMRRSACSATTARSTSTA